MELKDKFFGRWQVIRQAHSRGKHPYWDCRCLCGNSRAVNQSSLMSGLSTSCGCYSREASRAVGKANITHGMSGTPTYQIWQGIVQRCTVKTNPNYQFYGGAGVKLDSRWLVFENFLTDMGEKPEGKSIDRRKGTEGYSADNCRWATKKEQQRNLKNNLIVKFNGTSKLLIEWCEELGLAYQTIHSRLFNYGWSVEKALTQPIRLKQG